MVGGFIFTKCIVLFMFYTRFSDGLNLGLIAGDNKRLGSPLTIKKYSHKAPVFINIHHKPHLLPLLPPLAPKLPKPPPLLSPLKKLKSPLSKFKPPLPPKSLSSTLRKLRSPFSKSLLPKPSLFPKPLRSPLSKHILPKPLFFPPLIPKLPFLPLLPPILPPILPPLLPMLPILPPPILPPPILPWIPRLKLSPLSPVKVPILKTPLQKALGSEMKPVVLPCADNKDILGKLRELRKQGSLTTGEFNRFKKMLLKK